MESWRMLECLSSCTQPGKQEERKTWMPGFEGTWLGPYHLLQRLGSGEISNVYLAEQRGQERQVALKVIQQSGAAGSTKKQRQSAEKFISQLQTIAALKHPNLIPLY